MEAILLRDKRWTEPKKYGKISIRNEALKSEQMEGNRYDQKDAEHRY